MKRKAPATAGVPTPLPGMEGLTASTEARLIWWATRGRLHGAGGCWLAAAAIATATYGAWATRPLGTGTAVATFAVVVVVFLAVAPLYIAAVLLFTNAHQRPPTPTLARVACRLLHPAATQLVHPDWAGTWILTDHFAHRRGHGLAAPFRRRVFAHLAAEADRHQAVIVMDTHAEKLAHIYIHDMPGLRVIAQRHKIVNGHTWTLQRKLQPVSS